MMPSIIRNMYCGAVSMCRCGWKLVMLAINIDMHGSIMSHDLRLSQTNYRVSGSITVDDLAKIDKMNGRRICYF